jgi:hypothetical protein
LLLARARPVLALAKDLCLTPTQNSQETTTNLELAGHARLYSTMNVINADTRKAILQLSLTIELMSKK